MRICGLEKLSLNDYPGKLCAVLFTCRCNFRCPFCHNAPLVTRTDACAEIGEDTLFAFLNKRRGLLDGVCISGGEPLMHRDLPDLIARIRALGYLIKLDTNGSFPQSMEALIEAGLLDYVAMDIKNSPEKYALTCGLSEVDLAAVDRSARLLMQGRVDYEFRTTLVRELHGESDLLAIANWLRGAEKYRLQNFVDSGDTIAPGLHGFEKGELERFKTLVSGSFGSVELRGV